MSGLEKAPESRPSEPMFSTEASMRAHFYQPPLYPAAQEDTTRDVQRMRSTVGCVGCWASPNNHSHFSLC